MENEWTFRFHQRCGIKSIVKFCSDWSCAFVLQFHIMAAILEKKKQKPFFKLSQDRVRQSSRTSRYGNAIKGYKRIFSSSYEIHKLYINLFIWRPETQLSSVCCLSLQDWTCFWTLLRRRQSARRVLIRRVYSALCNQTALDFNDEDIKGQIITNRTAGQDDYNYNPLPTEFTSGRCMRFANCEFIEVCMWASVVLADHTSSDTRMCDSRALHWHFWCLHFNPG